MGEDRGFHVVRKHVLAAEHRHVADAPADIEFALVDEPDVAGAEISAVVLGAGDPRLEDIVAELGPSPVAFRLARPGHPDLACGARRHFHARLGVDDAEIDLWNRPPAARKADGIGEAALATHRDYVPVRQPLLVDGELHPAADRDPQRVLGQAVGDRQCRFPKAAAGEALAERGEGVATHRLRRVHDVLKRRQVEPGQHRVGHLVGPCAVVEGEVRR